MSTKAPLVPLGVLLAIACYVGYSTGDALIKALGNSVGMWEIGTFVTAFSVLPLLFAKPKNEAWRDTFKFRRPWLINLIAVLRICSSVCITYSFITIPLAEAYCIVFLIPIFITILSVVVLKEDVGIERWVLIAVSFAGVLLVVRPGFRELELGHLTALICAIAAAIATTATRLISGEERRISLLILPTLYIFIFNVGMLATGFKLPSLADFGVMLACGLVGGSAYILQIASLARSPASLIAPIQYSQIIWALIFGALFFAEFPDGLSIVGLTIVVVAGVVGVFFDGARARVSGRFAEYRARRKGAQPEPPPLSGPREV